MGEGEGLCGVSGKQKSYTNADGALGPGQFPLSICARVKKGELFVGIT